MDDKEVTQSLDPALRGDLTSGEFSNSLLLLLSNLTSRDSGTYRCSAHHRVTGEEIHLDEQVVITCE